MSRSTRRAVALAAAAFAGAATLAAVLGQVSSGSYELWWRTTSGGGRASGGSYELQGAVGQPFAASSSGGTFAVASGFLGGGGQDKYTRFLPQLARDGTN
ncbi:MAG: hypothetical protein KatS3mg062_1086 [Tepidiforma sp.]|nr:MAG: hypothetical protein KatS3mg062_1086 [Tepidiforma sp.]